MVHYRLAQRRSETHFSEVLRHGFALVNRVTPRMSHLREVHWARGVVCDNPIGTDQTTIAPSSLLLAYWMGGAFLMGAKRLSEYREIAAGPGVAVLHRYRRSFQHYTEESLTISCFVYAMFSTFLIGVFLVKYRIEYVLAFPFIILLFAHYLALSMRSGSVAQKPEKLFREKRLMAISAATVAALVLLSFITLPALQNFTLPHFVTVEAAN